MSFESILAVGLLTIAIGVGVDMYRVFWGRHKRRTAQNRVESMQQRAVAAQAALSDNDHDQSEDPTTASLGKL